MKALYRKYRPKNLSEVIGQEKVTSVLENSLKKQKISHAYIFTGPRGTGKTSVARIFAHEINNFTYELEDSYIDIVEIDGASNRGIDNIREIREKATIAPTKGKYKVYIIDEFHMLTKDAFNALLKTLEEPPAHVVFILATTDIEKVPITITSRAQLYSFSLAAPEIMHPHLRHICKEEDIKISDDALEIIVRRGGGSFRDSLSLLDQISTLSSNSEEITKELVEKSLGLPQDILSSNLLEAYTSKNLTEISDKLKSILSSGIKPETIATELIKKILASPTETYLPLLSKLPEVKDPFAEAKLLLALANFENSTKAPSIPSIPTSPTHSSLKPQASNPQTRPETPTNTQTPPKPAKETSKNTQKSTPIPQSSANFSWETYFEAVKKTSLGAAMWLKKCQFSLENNTLNLFPPTPTVKGILESTNNLRILTNCLGEISLKIHNAGESINSTKKDPKLTMINDIMGETQEVNNGGEIPF